MPENEKGGRAARLGKLLRRLDAHPRAVKTTQALRRLLPGDRDYGDPLSLAGSEPSQLIGQRLTALTAERPSALREAGLSALQVWQTVSESQGRGRGDEQLAILFTDLVDFSDWALEAGDESAVELLRCVGLAMEPAIAARDGRIVKRLGDGVMAVFPAAGGALDAALDTLEELDGVSVAGHRPRMRAGIHVGRPRKLGGDYFGVDVNIAARVAAAAGPEEVLVSERACEDLSDESVSLRRRRRFKGKGAPSDLKVFTASRDG